MKGVVLLLISALSSVSRGVEARAVDTNVTSFLASNATSLMLLDTRNSTISSESCNDINTCRTLSDIVQSCVLTILACVWFAVHRNIPAPNVKPQEGRSLLFRTAHTIWRTIVAQREAVIVFVVALIAPEWILAWALRQMFKARELVGELERASLKAEKMRQERCLTTSDSTSSPPETSGSAHGHSSSEGSMAAHDESEKTPLVHPTSISSTEYTKCVNCAQIGSQCDQVILKNSFGMGNEGKY